MLSGGSTGEHECVGRRCRDAGPDLQGRKPVSRRRELPPCSRSTQYMVGSRAFFAREPACKGRSRKEDA